MVWSCMSEPASVTIFTEKGAEQSGKNTQIIYGITKESSDCKENATKSADLNAVAIQFLTKHNLL